VNELPIIMARCCRDWPVLMLTPIGRCGYCGERPVPVWEESA
jgi:hypothetical protein